MTDIEKLVRKNILELKPYSSAREEFSGQAKCYMDANENPFESGINRYPDPFQRKLKEKIAQIKGLAVEQIILGNGSDEILDLIIRAFCEPALDNIIITPPTYGMYKVLGEIHNVQVRKALLNDDFGINKSHIADKIDQYTKLVFICSPNNPTGNSMDVEVIANLLKENNNCLFVIDEAYIDFSPKESWVSKLHEYQNLVICQTLSKARGMAGIRLGIGIASEKIVKMLHKLKPPYNINTLTQQKATEILDDTEKYKEQLEIINNEKVLLQKELEHLGIVKKVYPSDANFLLVVFTDAPKVYRYLLRQGIIVRDRSKEPLCENCLRITVGKPEENASLIEMLHKLTYS